MYINFIKYRIALMLFILTLLPTFLFANDKSLLEDILTGPENEYIIRMKNGDLITGFIIEVISDESEGQGIRLQTVIGKAIIYENQISDMYLKHTYYPHKHRIYLLPTSEPIAEGHFIGFFELLFIYAGVGISDWLSITAGRTLIPDIPSKDQISTVNLKLTPLEGDFADFPYSWSIGIGSNLAFVNDDNRLLHIYSNATVKGLKSIITLSLFYKTGSDDLYKIRFGRYGTIDMIYENGSIGLAAGLDTQFSGWHDLHFIGELWNINVGKPTHSGLMLGFRISNNQFSADFGLSVFTQPLMLPFVSFVWTPF